MTPPKGFTWGDAAASVIKSAGDAIGDPIGIRPETNSALRCHVGQQTGKQAYPGRLLKRHHGLEAFP
jgi:hypothetical protein